LKEEIRKVAAAERRSARDWIVRRLDQCVRDEQSLSPVWPSEKKNATHL
jgi:hypothetical protein